MPPIGLLLGGVEFSDLMLTLQQATAEVEAVTINYGVFIQTVVDFLIIGFAIFIVIKVFEKTKRKEEAKPAPIAEIPAQEKLLVEIRDLLKK